MPREYKVYLVDILSAIAKIERYSKDLDFSNFTNSELIVDGIVRNLEIIGEAVKNIPKTIKSKHKKIEWKKIAGLRDILIHEYFGVDPEILWDIVKNKIPDLKAQIKEIIG